MLEFRGKARWQNVPCKRCGYFHPEHCPDCSNDPPCPDHVCSWPDNAQED